MRYISIDIESTGLDPLTCDIIEFGAVLDDLSNPQPLENLPRFHTYVCKDMYKGQPYALSMHPKIFRRIAEREAGYNYTYPNNLGKAFKDFLLQNGYEEEKGKIVRINVAGKNFAAFDLQFLKQTNFTDSVRISSRILDPAILFFNKNDERLPGTDECLKRAGFEPNVAHTAIEDSLDVIKLIRYGLLTATEYKATLQSNFGTATFKE